MAKIIEQLAVVVGIQSAEGTVNTNVRDATEIGVHENSTTAVGVLVKTDSLAFDFEREEELGEDIAGSFTKTEGTRLNDLGTLSFDFTLKGPGTASPSAAGDYTLVSGIENVLAGAGVNRGTESTVSTTYNVGDASFLTLKLWRGDESFTLVDCKTSLSFGVNPGGSTAVSVTVAVGSVVHNASDIFPTVVDYGTMKSLSAPLMKSAGAQIGSRVRGQIDGSVSVDNTIDDAPDSNSSTGKIKEVTERAVNYTGKFYVDSADADQDWTNLVQTSTPSEDISFVLGTASSDPANAIAFNLSNLNFTKVTYTDAFKKIAWDLDGYATASGTTANSEFDLVSL